MTTFIIAVRRPGWLRLLPGTLTLAASFAELRRVRARLQPHETAELLDAAGDLLAFPAPGDDVALDAPLLSLDEVA
jgi:hypothetical protein